jgi:predicted histone-like DNA-binding protein
LIKRNALLFLIIYFCIVIFINNLNHLNMAIKIKSVQRRTVPGDIQSPQKFYASALSAGSTDFKKMSKRISNQCTVRPADCMAVLTALEENVIADLEDGVIVQLGDVGTLRVSISSGGKDTSDAVTSQDVKKARLLFRPGKGLSHMLKTLEYKKAE